MIEGVRISAIFQFWKTIGLILIIFCTASSAVFAQEDSLKVRKESYEFMHEAEDALAENNFPRAEAAYRKAIAKDPSNAAAKYNLGNSYFINKKIPEAEMRYKQALEVAETKYGKHKAFHNLGNVYMEKKNYPEAVRAYENALRNDPTDEETRYNLAYAKLKMKEENQNQGGDEDKDDQNQDGDGGEDQQKDQGDQNQQGDDGEKDQDKNEKEGQNEEKNDGQPKDGDQNQQQNQQDQNQQQNQPQPAQGKLSPEQVKSLLEAMENAEKKVQDKVNARKAQGQPKSTDKDW